MQNIKLLREMKGLSQKELARLLNISQQSIWKYETGASTPNIHILREMSDFFDTSIEYLIDDDKANIDDNMVCLTYEELNFITNYRLLPSQTKKMLRDISNQLVGKHTKHSNDSNNFQTP